MKFHHTVPAPRSIGLSESLTSSIVRQEWYAIRRVQEGGGGVIRVNKGNFDANEAFDPARMWTSVETPNKMYGSDGNAIIFPSLFTPPKAQDSAYVHERFARLQVRSFHACFESIIQYKCHSNGPRTTLTPHI